jgi:hypothetical protein
LAHVLQDTIQDRAGKAVANAARDDERQQQYGAAVGAAASNTEYQAAVGDYIASNTDNQYLAMAAQNDTVQQYTGSAGMFVWLVTYCLLLAHTLTGN